MQRKKQLYSLAGKDAIRLSWRCRRARVVRAWSRDTNPTKTLMKTIRIVVLAAALASAGQAAERDLKWERDFVHIGYLSTDEFLEENEIPVPEDVNQFRKNLVFTPPAHNVEVDPVEGDSEDGMDLTEALLGTFEDRAVETPDRSVYYLTSDEVEGLRKEVEAELDPTSVFNITDTLFEILALEKAAMNRWRQGDPDGFLALAAQPGLRRAFQVAFGGFFVFSSIFNYLPFYLHRPPFNASTEFITLLYLTYIVGIFIGPVAGQLSNRIGNGGTMVLGSLVFALAILLTLITSIFAIVLALVLVCAGFFSIHAAAAGSLNRNLTGSRGRANSLYVLTYYLGGAAGITLSGYAYGLAGWTGVAALGLTMLSIPLVTGLREMRQPATPESSREKLSPGV